VETEEGTPERELIPAGKYRAVIVTATVGPTKNGKGQAVSITWSIDEGQYEKRLVFQSILVQHESADGQRFGRRKFKDVCAACGINEPVTDLGVLLYKPCSISVSIRKDKDGQYPDRSEVTRVSSVISSWNGSKKILKEASSAPEGFEAKREHLNDDIPF
jgi:Protein of unknown function (DUF669)